MMIEPTCTALLVDKRLRILLIRRTKEPWKGLWGFPGGHVNKDEKLVEAVIREVKEETGLSVEAGKKPIEVFFYPVLDHYHRSHLFRCKIKGSSRLRPHPDWRHEGVLRWCKVTQKNLNPIVKHVFDRYLTP